MSNTALDGMTIGGTPGSGRWSVVNRCASAGRAAATMPSRVGTLEATGPRRGAAAGLRDRRAVSAGSGVDGGSTTGGPRRAGQEQPPRGLLLGPPRRRSRTQPGECTARVVAGYRRPAGDRGRGRRVRPSHPRARGPPRCRDRGTALHGWEWGAARSAPCAGRTVARVDRRRRDRSLVTGRRSKRESGGGRAVHVGRSRTLPSGRCRPTTISGD